MEERELEVETDCPCGSKHIITVKCVYMTINAHYLPEYKDKTKHFLYYVCPNNPNKDDFMKLPWHASPPGFHYIVENVR